MWKVKDVKSDGTATFEHSVEWIDMRQKLSGSSEVRYDSRTGDKPPVGFEDVAKSVRYSDFHHNFGYSWQDTQSRAKREQRLGSVKRGRDYYSIAWRAGCHRACMDISLRHRSAAGKRWGEENQGRTAIRTGKRENRRGPRFAFPRKSFLQ